MATCQIQYLFKVANDTQTTNIPNIAVTFEVFRYSQMTNECLQIGHIQRTKRLYSVMECTIGKMTR